MSVDEVQAAIKMVLEAVNVLHTQLTKPVIHRDIKARNILVTEEGLCKLAGTYKTPAPFTLIP